MLLRQILREEWRFDGIVVSDWESMRQLAVHGLTGDDRESAFEAANAGVRHGDGEHHLCRPPRRRWCRRDASRCTQLDAMVANVLRTKFRLGLFDDPYTDPAAVSRRG